jgi:U3 small nucleolar RNA-associated protein 19
LTKHLAKDYPVAAENLLNILERIQTFPTEASELNQWWIPELGKNPPVAKSAKFPQDDDAEQEDTEEQGEDDWRKFFDESAPAATKQKSGGPNARLYKMTVHQSLHSLASHRAVFSRAWLTVLPRLNEIADAEKRKALSMKALNVMHRGVIPHLTRPVMIMDWVGSCVDYGGCDHYEENSF